MQRQTFLRTLISLAAVPFARPALANASEVNATTTLLHLQESPIAGFQYHDGEAAWPDLHIGMPLQLRRESDNPHDPRAVEIWAGGHKLGYLPRLDNCAVSQLLDAGHRLHTQIVALRDSVYPWQRVRFRVYLAD